MIKARRIISIFLLIGALVSVFSMSGCFLDNGYDWIDIPEQTQNPTENEQAEEKPNQMLGDVYITNNDVTINGQENSAVYAAALGLRSAVSVYSEFERTVTSGYPWNPSTSTETYYSAGSGVIYKTENDGSAFVITNFHVVYDADSNTSDKISDSINLYLYGMEANEYAISATYVGGSAYYDIAVLRVNASGVLLKALESGAAQAITLGDSDKIIPGQTAIAIGNPSGDGISVTKGIVNVDSEYIEMEAPDSSGTVDYRVIRVDTPINKGNSGGGLYDDKGRLIGVVNAKIISSEVENIAYAIPSAVAHRVANNIIDNCYGKSCKNVMRATLGVIVAVTELKTEYDTQSGILVKTETVAIDAITADGLAEKAGFGVGDVLVSIKVGDREAQSVGRMYHLIDELLCARVGDTVAITYIDADSGLETTATVTVTEGCLTKY